MIQNKAQFQEFISQAVLLLIVLTVSVLIPLGGAFYVFVSETNAMFGEDSILAMIFFFPVFLIIFFFLSLVMSIFFWPMLLALYQGIWTARHRQLLSLLLTSREAQVPLAPMVREYAASCFSPYYAKKLRRFADALERGFPVKEALTKYPGIMRSDFVAMLDASPNDSKTLQSIENALEAEKINSTSQPSLFVRLIYLLGVIYMFASISFFLFVFVVPKFEEIFWNFDTDLPAMTQLTCLAGRFMFPFVIPFVILMGLFLLWVCFIVLIHSGLMRSRPIGLRRLFRCMDSARLLRVFGAGLRGNLPWKDVTEIYNWSVMHSGYLLTRSQRIRRRILEGHSWIQTLRKEKIISSEEVPILESAQRVGNLSSVLDDIAMGKMRKQSNQVDDFSKVVYFVMLFSLAALVGFFVVSMFLPLIKLIQDLS